MTKKPLSNDDLNAAREKFDDGRIHHRLKQVRHAAGMSLRTVSRRTGVSMRKLKQQEDSNDLSLADLVLWKEALGVPFMELFRDSPDRTEAITRMRAGLIQLMRSAKSLKRDAQTDRQSVLAENMIRDLIGLMPELHDIGSWPQNMHRRRSDEPARVESQVVATALWCPEIRTEV